MVGALGQGDTDITFVETSSTSANPATANTYHNLILGNIEIISCQKEEWETVTEDFGLCRFRQDAVQYWNMDTPWTIFGRTGNRSTILQNVVRLIQPETNLFSHGSFGRFIVLSSGLRMFYDKYRLMKRAFDLEVVIDKTLLDMITKEPEFLPVVNDMVKAFVENLRAWDEDAEFLIRAFTDPEASVGETLQFVVHYSDNISRDEMNKKWDEAADKLDEIIPTKEQRMRVGISFQPFL